VKSRFLFLWLLSIAALLFFALMRWGGYLLISNDPLPVHADVAVVLQGSILAEQQRLRGALQLLQGDKVTQILVSIPKESYWGQSVAPIARSYIARKYGQASADRTTFCESGPEVNSTQQEASVLSKCVMAYGWHSMILVTSDYHSRRARIIWKKVLRHQNSSIEHVSIYGVGDAEFHAVGWWQDRLSAKTWVTECIKLLWTSVAAQ
jgi:hypothetical protein